MYLSTSREASADGRLNFESFGVGGSVKDKSHPYLKAEMSAGASKYEPRTDDQTSAEKDGDCKGSLQESILAGQPGMAETALI